MNVPEPSAVVREGGCLCGAFRVRVQGEPLFTSVCHCTACQRRTGSAFGIGVYFEQSRVILNGAATGTYEHRSDTSGRGLRMRFCAHCGSTVCWTVELYPGAVAIAAGCLDDPSWVEVTRHVWTRSSHAWVALPAGVQRFERGSRS